MKKLMNITDCDEDLVRYKDPEDLEAFLDNLGLDGLEMMFCDMENPRPFLQRRITGVHLRFYNEWADAWRGDKAALVKEYGSLDEAMRVFGSTDHDTMLKNIRRNLEIAHSVNAKYVVFHVCNVKDSELFTYEFAYSDEEIIDLSIEIINELLDGAGYEFEFLMENLWWPGLNFRNAAATKRLLDGVHYEKKGIMLDTGHLAHMNPDLSGQDDAARYILNVLEEHREVLSYIRGMHLNMSITGDYVRAMLADRENMPKTHREQAAKCFYHIFNIDKHLPFTSPLVNDVIRKADPEYLTMELITATRGEHEAKLRGQLAVLDL